MSFEGALSESAELLLLLEQTGRQDDAALLSRLEAMLASQPSCRGFFVTLLTGDSKLADDPPTFLLDTLGRSPIASELLVKNLVMSSATAVVHQRKGDTHNEAGSKRVSARSLNLICKLQSTDIRPALNEMKLSLQNNGGRYAEFVSRCNYDREQRDTACSAIEKALTIE